ncbi:hypothetical protein OG417_32920 [Actinoallomurus sp. NBC_01490]|uniref:hypothetical protein n=1 Tax=Actinoallomurus sp. NBC_01490 TaxID=2903557 RepID=UPI002E303611|nr:hypothetical protein [Actinoallomurus sp. NBC_01490]
MFDSLKWRQRRERRLQNLLNECNAKVDTERKAARTPLERLDPLIRELVEMGDGPGYGNDRARKIGELLNDRGGMGYMQAVYYEVFNWHPITARELQRVWDGIGDWQA